MESSEKLKSAPSPGGLEDGGPMRNGIRTCRPVELQGFTVYKIDYSVVDEKPELRFKCLKIMVGHVVPV